uniref:Uncharacterized protein n=1 Tax=Salix viminalis TaxID=40686 RepID=A0A6N2M970_SALVM
MESKIARSKFIPRTILGSVTEKMGKESCFSIAFDRWASQKLTATPFLEASEEEGSEGDEDQWRNIQVEDSGKSGDVVKDYPGYVPVKHFGIRAKPLEPQQELKAKKVYFLVELPKLPEEKDPRNTRRVRSGINMSAKDRLETVSDLPMVRSAPGQTSDDGTNSVRVKVRLPKAQVQKLVEESRNEVEVAEKIIGLYMDNSGEVKGEHDPSRNWQPELGSITESFKATDQCVWN